MHSTVQVARVGKRTDRPTEIELEVRGSRPHIGKSYIAELLRRTLAEHGLSVNVVSGDNDQAMFQHQTASEFKANFAGMVGKLSPKITIVDNNVRTEGKV